MLADHIHGCKPAQLSFVLALCLGSTLPATAVTPAVEPLISPSAGGNPFADRPADLTTETRGPRLDAPQPPDTLFGPLFDAVQRAKLYPDQKTFADAVPRQAPAAILAAYRQQYQQAGFDLKRFVEARFDLPAASKGWQPPAGQSLRQHIDGLWPILTRKTVTVRPYDSLLPLPESYVVPGGRFREVYYWDSYFTMLGLAESGQWTLVKNMIDNFAHEIDVYGHIPNGNRSYYLSRSQPPFFSFMVTLLAQHQGGGVYARYLPELKQEYAYWMQGSAQLPPGQASERVVRLDDGSLLNRYWDDRDVPRTESYSEDIATAAKAQGRSAASVYRDLRAGAASGWDFSSRWLGDPNDLSTIRTTALVPVDLNALLHHLETTLAEGSKALDAHQDAAHYTQLAQQRRQAINHYLWNEQDGYYTDYDWQRRQITRPVTAATVFPLWLKIAPQDRAGRVAATVRNLLLKPGGLVTTTVNNGQQWDAPNGWAPLHWVAVQGFGYYGQDALARVIGTRFLANVKQLYQKEHKLVEKYVVEGDGLGGGGGGEYALQDGFGWTNGITLMLLDAYCAGMSGCSPADRPVNPCPDHETDARAPLAGATTSTPAMTQP